MNFNANKTKKELVSWIRNQMYANGGKTAVIGISGGKDSSVVAALCVEALGRENVVGVLMPQGDQYDISYSYDLVNHLGIEYYYVNIGETVQKEIETLEESLGVTLPRQARTNIPPRIRMTTLYAIAQTFEGGRVTCNGNASEAYVGYFTKYGDGAGDFAPIINLTTDEVVELGRHLWLPTHLIEKTPEDGLTGKSDEESLGFSYDELNSYIREGISSNPLLNEKIFDMNYYNKHKLELMPRFEK